MVREFGNDITLAGRYTTRRSTHGAKQRPNRPPKLTLRGPRVREVFRLVVQKTKAAGISLWKLPMATVQGQDEFDNPQAGESEEALAPLQEEENNVNWVDSPPASESDVEEPCAEPPVHWREAPASQISAAASSAESSRRATVTVSHAASAEPASVTVFHAASALKESLVRNAREACEDRSVKKETKEQVEHVIQSEAKVGSQIEAKVAFCTTCLKRGPPADVKYEYQIVKYEFQI